MLAEPTKTVYLSDLELPKVSLGKSRKPKTSFNFTDEEIWNFAGDRGVFSDSPAFFKFCFDVLVHRDNTLIYRMKPQTEWFLKVVADPIDPNGQKSKSNSLFDGILIHDSMECFIQRECLDSNESDHLCIMHTHDNEGEEFDVLENWCTVPYDRFNKYLDTSYPMTFFESEVREYLDEQSELRRIEHEKYLARKREAEDNIREEGSNDQESSSKKIKV